MSFKERIYSVGRYLAGKKTAGSVYRLVVEMTNACNLDCNMCPRKHMKREVEYMDKKIFESILSENYKTLEFVSLNGFGEPLLHPEFDTFIKMCRQYGVGSGVSTNCTLLDEKRSALLLEASPDVITLAIDGVGPESYERVRKGAKFDKVMTNVNRFLHLHSVSKSTSYIILQCIQMTETKDEIEAFKTAFSKYSYDCIRIRQLTHSGRGRTDDDYSNGECSCYWLWNEPMILSNGTMVACCQDVNGVLPLGDIRNDSLDALWKSSKQICTLRNHHSRGERSVIPVCAECNMYQPGIMFAVGASLLDSRRINRFIPGIETFLSRLRYRSGE